jgi:hypothetical protein
MAQSSTPASRIVHPIDEAQLIALKGTMHPLANAKNDRGAVPDSMQLDRMHLVLTRDAGQQTALRQLIGEMHTPGAANFHKWLTPDEFGKQFGPSDEDIATVEIWLAGHGFNVAKVNPGKQTIEFSGNAAQFRNAFHAEIHQYEVNGQTHYANAGDPKIPAALAPVVGGFVSLNNFQVKHPINVLGKATYDAKTHKATPDWTRTTNPFYLLSPGDYAVQYDLAPLYAAGINGSGQSIAIINASNINVGLANQFRTLFGLPANPPQVIIDGNDPGVNGINNPGAPNGWAEEAYLDVEWAGAVAPNATVYLVIAADTEMESGLMLAAEHAVYGNVAPIISLSASTCEHDLTMGMGNKNSFMNALWEQAAAQGITVVLSAGDAGSAGCDDFKSQYYAVNGQAVSGFASTPYNVSVGGTDFYYSDWATGAASAANYWNTTTQMPAVSLKQRIPEQVWNNSQYGLNAINFLTTTGGTETTIMAGSGGPSTSAVPIPGSSNDAGYPKPSWQIAAAGIGVPSDGVRDIPDVSLFAATGANYSTFPVCANDGDCQSPSGSNLVQIDGLGGTSAAAPSFAGMMALVNQKYGRQGQADYVLYPLAMQFPAAFHDVTIGSNSVPCAYGTSPDCIAVANPVVITDPFWGTATEGQTGAGTTPYYNATPGYDLASGLGTIDANVLVTDWNKVTFAATTTTLTPSATKFTHGTPITVSGTVTSCGTPSGNVALMTNSTEPVQQGQSVSAIVSNGQVTGGQSTFTLDSSGAFTGTNTTLPGGTYSIWGSYSGDGTNGMSTSTPVQITVTPENSNLTFQIFSAFPFPYTPTSPPTSSVPYGTSMILTAQAVPASGASVYTVPTGTVTFTDTAPGSGLPYTAVINAEGDAEYNAPFSVGSHSVTASYSGDSSYNKLTSAPIPFTVAKGTPSIGVAASNCDVLSNVCPVAQNQPTLLNVTVVTADSGSPVMVAPPTGTVTVSGLPAGVPTSAILRAAVNPWTIATEGVAVFTIPASASAGTYNLTVNYSGDANYTATSGTASFTIQGLTGKLVSTTAASVAGTVSPTTSITVTGTVTGQSGHPAPTGTVIVYSSGYNTTTYGSGVPVPLSVPSSGDVSNFSITLNSQNLFQGANFVTLQYSGDSTYYPSAFQLANPISNPLADFTMVPQTTIVPVTAGSSGTTTINLASLNGFGGAVSLACKAATGVTCALSSNSLTLAPGGSGSVTLTINAAVSAMPGNYSVLITGTDPTGKYVHNVAVLAAVSLPAGTGGVTVTPVVAQHQPYYNEEQVRITNPAALTALSITITIQKTTGLTFNGLYNTVGSQIQQSHATGASTFTYNFTLTPGQTVSAGNWTFAAQTNGTGTAHPTSGDTYTVTYTTGGQTYTQTGHF